MDNITLTGGTLMGDNHNHNHSHSHSHSHGHHNQYVDPLETPQPHPHGKPINKTSQQVVLSQEQQLELSKLVLKPGGQYQQQQQQQSECQHHSHSHGHNHSHGHDHTQGQNNWKNAQGQIQVPAAAMSLMMPLEDILKGSPQEIMEALSTLLRLGQYEKWEQLAHTLMAKEKDTAATANNSKPWWVWMDSNGHTLLHWAAKRGDDKRFVEFFVHQAPSAILKELLHTTSHDNTAMTPLHWACTEPGAQSLGILALFMSAPCQVDWEVTDASGCTPLLIAAQYGQVEVCAYLLQKGQADLYAMDNSRDSALHWAAYKGSLPVCGLLWWYHDQQQQNHHRGAASYGQCDLMAPDQYGQTPIHLASLRGHTSVVRWLLHKATPSRRDKMEVLYHKDTNGRTPLDLAIHKKRPTVQAVLQQEMDALQHFNMRDKSQWEIWQRHVRQATRQLCSYQAWRLWLGLSDFNDEMEGAPRFPYHYVWLHAILHIFFWYPVIFCPVHAPANGLLWDFPFWHLLNIMNLLLAVFFLHKTTRTNPGNLVVDDEATYQKLPKEHRKVVQYWRKLYETTLESYATTKDMQKAIKEQPLCHTCHIARPLRSKHCRVTRTCVLMFDHHCPFVGNTVGLYNYPYFYMFLATCTFVHIGFIFNLALHVHRSKATAWPLLCLGVFQAIHILMFAGMLIYHTQLSASQLTTNEHMNVARYEYLMERTGNTKRYRNPWFKSYFRNCLDRLSPSQDMYLMPRQYQTHGSGGGAEDDVEKQERQGLLHGTV